MSERIIVQRFGNRQPLPMDSAAFAARGRRLEEILCALAAETTQSVSVSGPPKSGKSSLLQQLSGLSERQNYPVLANAVVVQADFLPHRGRAQDAMQHLIHAIADRLQGDGIEVATVRACASVREAVGRALSLVPGRLIMAIDNFEAVGSDLRKDDQADLHAAVYKRDRAAFVLASRLPLSRCLEEFGDPLSDLAPICAPVIDGLAPLSEAEIAAVIRGCGEGIEAATAAALAKAVYERVGGFAPWVQQALALIFRRPLDQGNIVDEAQRALSQDLFPRLEQDLMHGYRKLPSTLKRYMDEGAFNESTEQEGTDARELELAGWCVPGAPTFTLSCSIVREWIGKSEANRQATKKNSVDAEPFMQLLDVTGRLNRKHQLATKRSNETILRMDVFHKSSDVAFLRRRVLSEEDFGRLILTLGRLLYEGSGGGLRNAKLKLPDPCYSDPRSIVFQVAQMRHGYVHLENPDPQEESKKVAVHSDFFQSVLGRLPASQEDFQRLAGAALTRTIEQLERLVEVCPFSSSLDGDFIFGALEHTR